MGKVRDNMETALKVAQAESARAKTKLNAASEDVAARQTQLETLQRTQANTESQIITGDAGSKKIKEAKAAYDEAKVETEKTKRKVAALQAEHDLNVKNAAAAKSKLAEAQAKDSKIRADL